MDNSINIDEVKTTGAAVFLWLDELDQLLYPDKNNKYQYIKNIKGLKGIEALNFEALKSMFDQLMLRDILRRWRPRFGDGEFRDPADAVAFLQHFYSALESVDDLLDYRCTGGLTPAVRGECTDIRTFRPGEKRGWGLHLTLDGQARYQCLRRSLHAKRGDLVLLSPTAFYDYGRHAEAESWHHHWVVFRGESRWSPWLNWPEVGGGVGTVRCADESELQRLIAIFREVARLSTSRAPDTINLRHSLVEQLLIRAASLIPGEKRAGVDPRVETAMAYIEANLSRDLRLEEVAAAAHLSVSSLKRLFKAATGLSVIAWRDEKRMAAACEQLAHSRQPVARIAEALGYPDPLYFSRRFRQCLGVSPSRYRGDFLPAGAFERRRSTR